MSNPDWKQLAACVQRVLDGGDFRDEPKDIAMAAIAYDLIRSEDQTTPCPTCGTSLHHFTYFKVTGAGRLLAEAYRETQP